MDQRKQTTITDFNREQYYKTLYPVASMTKKQMIDITDLENPVLVDCAGKFYKKTFNQKILVVETSQTAKEFAFEKFDFDVLLKVDTDVVLWPSKIPYNSDIVFDNSKMIRYKNLDELQSLIKNLIDQRYPNSIHLRMHLYHLDDMRLCDRFYNISLIKFDDYVVLKFLYDTKSGIFEIVLKRKYANTN